MTKETNTQEATIEENNNTDIQDTQMIVLPEVTPAELLKSDTVQEIITNAAQNSHITAQEIEDYYKEGLSTMFTNQNMTLEEFTKVFNQVIDIEGAKKEAQAVIDDYSTFNGDKTIKEALRELDDGMSAINPLFKRIKRGLEDGAGLGFRIKSFFVRLFGGQRDDLVTSTLQGLKGRIVSIDESFQVYEEQLLLNQTTAEKHIPSLGVEIYKTDGMAQILEQVNATVEHEGTKEFLNNMVTQLYTISGIKKGNLQRFILAARMNGNAQLLLRGTQFKIFGVMPSLLALNFVMSTQDKVNKVSDMAEDFMDSMVEQSKKQMTENMTSEITAKENMKTQLEKVVTDIKWVQEKIADHKKNLASVQRALDDYMPIYKEKVASLDQQIFATDISDDDFIKVSDAVINKMKEQREALAIPQEIIKTPAQDVIKTAAELHQSQS